MRARALAQVSDSPKKLDRRVRLVLEKDVRGLVRAHAPDGVVPFRHVLPLACRGRSPSPRQAIASRTHEHEPRVAVAHQSGVSTRRARTCGEARHTQTHTPLSKAARGIAAPSNQPAKTARDDAATRWLPRAPRERVVSTDAASVPRRVSRCRRRGARAKNSSSTTTLGVAEMARRRRRRRGDGDDGDDGKKRRCACCWR